MRTFASDVEQWLDAGRTVALAIVVGTTGSAPRPVGTMMAVSDAGAIAGNVSAGCVDAAVVGAAVGVLEGGPAQVVEFGISDDAAASVGLTCGGGISVLVLRVPDDPAWLRTMIARVVAEEAVAVATVVSGPASVGATIAVTPEGVAGTLGTEGLDVAVVADARGLLASGDTAMRHYGPTGPRRHDDVAVLVCSLAPPPRMLVFGAIDFAAAMAELGTFLGYRVTVCDARPAFATRERFPTVDDVVVEWPHRYLERTAVDESTVLCVLTHDPKFDVPLLQAAVRTPASYIGVMGSRRSQDDRFQRLRDAGVAEADLERLRAPIGLDLGARTPAETAVSIAAEIIALRWHGSGRPLREVSGAIHAAEVPV